MPFTEELPKWEAAGSAPPAAKTKTGWGVSEKPPADWFNYQWSRTYWALKELQEKAALKDDLTTHTGTQTTVHGSTSAATANKLIHRDAAGRAQVAAPAAAGDIAIKSTVDNAITTAAADATAKVAGAITAAAQDATNKANAAREAAAGDATTKADAAREAAITAAALDATTKANAAKTAAQDAANAALALKAPLNSPTFTGTPIAPTPAPGTNTKQIATADFVQAAIAALINAAPGSLDTLKELATAMGNDPNFAATITNALALKAPLASPALTGTPTAPTPAPGTNTSQVATAAFVAALGALKANLASPNFTGTPTAPVSPLGTATNQIATMQNLQSESNTLAKKAIGIPTGTDLNTVVESGFYRIHTEVLNGPPNANNGQMIVSRGLDTIAQIVIGWSGGNLMYVRGGSPPDVGGRSTWGPWWQAAKTDSPEFTGVPTAPTAAAGTSSKQLATTEFVQNNTGVKGDNFKAATALPSTYSQGQTIFFVNNVTGWPAMYGTVVTIKGHYSESIGATQYFYPYNIDAPIKYRHALYGSDTWKEWRDLIDSTAISNASTANKIPVRDANKKIAEVAANRTVLKDVLVNSSQEKELASFTLSEAKLMTVKAELLMNAIGTVKIVVRYIDTWMATQNIEILPSTSLTGRFQFIPLSFLANTGKVSLIASSTNTAGTWVSGVITEEG